MISLKSSPLLDSHDRKIALSFGAVILALMLIATGIASHLFSKLNLKEEDRLSGTIAIILAESIAKVSFSGKYHARLFIEEMQTQVPELVFISLETREGMVLAHSQPEKNDTSLKGEGDTALRAMSIKQQAMTKQDRLYEGLMIKELVFPYRSGLNDEVIGVVRIGIKMDQVHQEQRATYLSVLLLIALLTVAAIAGVLLLSHYLGDEHRFLAAQLQGILYHAPMPICISNRDDQLLASSIQFTRLFGKPTPGQNLGTILNNNLSEADGAKLMTINRNVFEQGIQHEDDIELDLHDQSCVWHISAFPIVQDNNNQTTMSCLFIHDITERKQAEKQIIVTKEQWEKTFDAIQDVITIHDKEMRIVRANKAAGELFHSSPTQLIGRYCYELFRNTGIPCDGCPEIQARLDQVNHQARIFHPNLGKTFETVSFPIIDHSGATGFVHIAKDITKSLQLEEQLKQAQKMEAIGTLAGGIAHDFNNILTPILGYAEIAQTRITPDAPLYTDLQQINMAAIRAKELVQQILTFSRQSSQEKIPLQPHLVIKEALKLLRASLPTTIEIQTDIATDCGAILADPTQFHQIIMNLCTNAYHAMEKKGGILGVCLSATTVHRDDNLAISRELPPGEYLLLEVSDTGCGIDKTILQRIFDPYFTTKDSNRGTGLGLSVVHGIVESYHGHILLSSEPGKGSTFSIYLPRLPAAPITGTNVLHSPLPIGTERILLVDDEKIITDMLQTILSAQGFQTTCINDSQEALTLLKKESEHFDLLITDMTMPHLTGLELASTVMSLRPEMPVILCTGFSELINREQAHAIGIRAFLMKPVSVRELTMTVHQILNENRSTTPT